MLVRVKRLRHGARLPVYQSIGAAGADLHACLDGPFELYPGMSVAIPTGIALELPEGYEAQVRPRSGLAAKHGVTVLNAPGTVDEDYRGEVKVLLVHHGIIDALVRPPPLRIENGDRIAQLVIAPTYRAGFEWTDELSETSRGAGGFGSTGLGGGR